MKIEVDFYFDNFFFEIQGAVNVNKFILEIKENLIYRHHSEPNRY